MTGLSMDFAEAIAAMEATGDYRVLRRFVRRDRYAAGAGLAFGLYVDVESTGLDTAADEIIEFSAVLFDFDVDGTVRVIHQPLSWLEEPKTRAISAEITELTGITPEMVKGQRIDDEAVRALLAETDLVIAHNADYDRRMCERRIPDFAKKPWACSQREVPWKKFGVNGGALGNILLSACREFTDEAHRADADCCVGVHVLAAAACDGRTALSYLLESSNQPTHRVCAVGSPMWAKDALRGRGYRALYQYGRFAYWYRDLKPDGKNVEDELLWCREEAGAYPKVRLIDARDRYSLRADQ